MAVRTPYAEPAELYGPNGLPFALCSLHRQSASHVCIRGGPGLSSASALHRFSSGFVSALGARERARCFTSWGQTAGRGKDVLWDASALCAQVSQASQAPCSSATMRISQASQTSLLAGLASERRVVCHWLQVLRRQLLVGLAGEM